MVIILLYITEIIYTKYSGYSIFQNMFIAKYLYYKRQVLKMNINKLTY